MSFIQNFFTSRDNNANAETFVGQEGRLWFNPVTNQIYSSDGNTPGGIPLAGGGGGNGTPGGSNSQVQFNNNGAFGGTANLTINSATGALTAVSFIGNGAGLTSITGANVTGTVADAAHATVADSANAVAGGNVTGNVSNATHAYFADVANSVAGANVTGTVANATYATSAGSATTATTAGTANAVAGANVSGTVANATYALSANSASSLVNGSSSVILNSDGTMTFPSNIINTGSNPITLWSTDSSSLLWRSPTGGGPGSPVQTIVSADNGNATISVATGTVSIQSIKSWTFDTAGNTTFPDATVQTTAYPGTATAFSVTGNVTGGNVIGTTGVSVGGTGGDLTMTGGAITGAGNITSNGIMAINAPGGITTTAGSFDIVNATATTVNIGGSATAVNIGAITGTATINNPTIVGSQTSLTLFNTTASNVSTFGAASNLIVGATSGTMTLRNPTIVGTQTTQSLFNTVATTVNFAGAATALNIGGAGNATFSANTQVRVSNTGGSALSVAGNITGGNITTTGAVYSNYNTNTANVGSFMATGGNTKGGTGYLDFLVAQNTSGGATNPYKWIRLNSTGGLEIINSAYTQNIFNLTDAGVLTVPSPILVGGKQAINGPAFRAYVDSGQTISTDSQQKVTFGGETFDTNSNFASSRFTPTIEGYYQLNATVRLSGNSGTGECMIILYKNGAEYARGTNESGTEQGQNFWSMQVSDIAYANGSTDYFEIYIQQGSATNRTTTAGQTISYFSGSMIRGA
jgi:hypothetical protein